MDYLWLKNEFDRLFKEIQAKSDDREEVRPQDLYADATNFWKNNSNEYSANVGQLTGLLADYGAYLLNKKAK